MRSCGVGVFCRLYSAGGVQQVVYSVQQELVQQLTVLRERVGKVQEKPPKVILNDKDIQNIVDALPNTLTDLKKIKNIGDQKIKLVGKDVISLIKNLETKLNNQQSNSRTKINRQTQSSTEQQNQNLEFEPQNYETKQFTSPKNFVQENNRDEIFNSKVDNKESKKQFGVVDFQPGKNLNMKISSIGDTSDIQESKNIAKQEKIQFDIDDKKSFTDKQNEMNFENIQSGQNIGDESQDKFVKTENVVGSEQQQQLSKQNLRQSISGQSNSQIQTTLNKLNSENIEANKNNEQEYFSPQIEFQNGDVVFAKKKKQSGGFLSSVWNNIDQLVKKVTG